MPSGYAPPTPPKPRVEDGAYRVILDKDIPVDFTEYFTKSEDEEECELKKPWAAGRLTQRGGHTPHEPEMSHADTGEVDNKDTLIPADESRCGEVSILNGTSKSAYDADTSTQANDVTTEYTPRKRRLRRKFPPILRTSYYRWKRLRDDYRKQERVWDTPEWVAGF